MVRNLAVIQDPVQPLGQEDPLKKGTATQSSILAWRAPRTEEPAVYTSWGCQEWDTAEHLSLSLPFVLIRDGKICRHGRECHEGRGLCPQTLRKQAIHAGSQREAPMSAGVRQRE